MKEFAEYVGTLMFYLVMALLALAACAFLVTLIVMAVHTSIYIITHGIFANVHGVY